MPYGRRELSKEQQNQIKSLHESGQPVKAIAALLDIGKRPVERYLREIGRLGAKGRPRLDPKKPQSVMERWNRWNNKQKKDEEGES